MSEQILPGDVWCSKDAEGKSKVRVLGKRGDRVRFEWLTGNAAGKEASGSSSLFLMAYRLDEQGAA